MPAPEQSPVTLPPDDEATRVLAKPLAGQDTSTEIQTVAVNATAKPAGKIPATSLSNTLLDSLGGNLTASSSLSPDQDLSVGVILKERFVLQEVLGKGGMGTVFKALDLRKLEANDRDTFVAIKVLNRDFRIQPVALIALQREAKRAQTLSHPNIITVYDFDRDGAHVFMSMEFLHGQPLSRLIGGLQGSGLPFKQAWPFIDAMGQALAYAHKKNIIHSDFKPGNVFVSDQNEIKVLDFGIACAAARPGPNEEKTVFNARELGALTPAYASLEQSRGLPPDPRDDIYALACVAYELLSGKHPYGRLSAEKALELDLQAKPIPGLKHKPWKALQRGLALQQEERIASVEGFLKLLRPHSRLFYGVWAAGILAVSVTGVNLYLNLTEERGTVTKILVELKPEQLRKIDDLLELAAIHFEVGYLTAPTGSNALWAYQEILKLDPYNEKAIAGIGKIADTLEQSAWELYEKGERVQSLKKVLEGLEADPHHEGLLKLKRKLEE
ncbi:MAG: serine/threonine-protein kinase [Methylococcaceae bacterium]|nr:serine/threonine-protein kinase [Methylococcaceae bacterium]